MTDEVISVEGLSKRYRLGEIGGGTLQEDFAGWWARLRGRSDPRLKIGSGLPAAGDHWALRDVSFRVRQGEVLGIVGRNGAGKSTLLKILSRTTAPTHGCIRVRGRVASLLEVGTGFHPELTGRDNIFLNGAILGMRKTEIARKLDEIIDFSGVERFIDTPVKRYSSGMYVRLAFAVAAHLEPEILVVDEVLAVGDADFQKKCLGKMQQVSRGGRTVLFVSHNLAMVSSLCDVGVHLAGGALVKAGTAQEAILSYAGAGGGESPGHVDFARTGQRVGDSCAQLLSGSVLDASGRVTAEILIGEKASVRMVYRILSDPHRRYFPNFHFMRSDGSCAFVVNATDVRPLPLGDYAAVCEVPSNFLNDGLYSVRLALTSFETGVTVHIDELSALTFNVRDPIDGVASRAGYAGPMPGAVRPVLKWTIEPLETA
jgi:lipopolysaccharide transport system ATP-binding protein